MPVYPVICGNGSGETQNDAYTYYYPILGHLDASSEANTQILARDSYTLANLSVRIITNTLTGTATYKSRIDGGDGNLIVTVGATLTGLFQDVVNSDAIVTGNLFNTELDTQSGGTSIIFTLIGYTLTTVANTTPILATTYVPGVQLGRGQIRFMPICGFLDHGTPEADAQYIFRVASTLSNFAVHISTNDLESTITFRVRVDGGDVNQSVDVGAGATGRFEDAVNTDVIAPGEAVNFEGDGTSSGGSGASVNSAQVKSTSAGQQIGVADPGPMSTGNNQTVFFVMAGSSDRETLTELNTQMPVSGTDLGGKNMFVRVKTNSVNGNTVVVQRINGADGNLTVTVPSATTGTFEDLVSTDDFDAADLWNFEAAIGGNSGFIYFNYIVIQVGEQIAPEEEPKHTFRLHPRPGHRMEFHPNLKLG